MQRSIFRPKLPVADWRSQGLKYYNLNSHYRHLFGCRVQKISLDGGFTCPNVDGTVAVGGCVFCDNRAFSPSRRVHRDAITAQIQRGIEGLQRRYQTERFLAYFQPATNTYGPLDKLRSLWEIALEDPRIVGLVIGTRPDCLPDEILDLVDQFAQQTYVSLELGVQTIHDRSLDWMNRGHHHDASMDAIERCYGRSFEIGVHIMLGLPGEDQAMMMATADQVAQWNVDSVKLHNLYVVEGTPLAEMLRREEVRMLELSEYVEIVADFLERLPPQMVIERISGDAPPKNLIAPQWSLHKGSIKDALLATFQQRGTCQSARWHQAEQRTAAHSGHS
ncbi:MAG: TIGR01212 family radical SAM protein [Pirellulaceae bacterium]|nr:TIGR01212 family radical SAM protein [Pirellulaceae bacterium]